MALEQINVGGTVNDGTGDDLRAAFIKINQNFQVLDGATLNAASLGSSGAEVYAGTSNNTANFRRIVAGENIGVSELENTIVISSSLDSRFTITTDTGSVIAGNGIPLQIEGANGILVSADENTKTIRVTGGLTYLDNELDVRNNNITNAGTITTTNIGLESINGFDYNLILGRYIEGFDFGTIQVNSPSILDWVVRTVGVDLGTFNDPANGIVDLGNIA